jgi:hypothetical protein
VLDNIKVSLIYYLHKQTKKETKVMAKKKLSLSDLQNLSSLTAEVEPIVEHQVKKVFTPTLEVGCWIKLDTESDCPIKRYRVAQVSHVKNDTYVYFNIENNIGLGNYCFLNSLKNDKKYSIIPEAEALEIIEFFNNPPVIEGRTLTAAEVAAWQKHNEIYYRGRR